MSSQKTLKSIAFHRLIDEMVASVKSHSGWKVMIVDRLSMRIISAACRMFDIVDRGVSLVEDIEKSREPIPDTEALYFISPTPNSIELLVKDFQHENKPTYGTVHLFFTSHVPDELFKKITASAALSKRIKTLNELNLEFLAVESQVFSLDVKDDLASLFGPDMAKSGATKIVQHKIASQLTTLCATLKEFPHIRYSRTHGMAGVIASIVQDRLKDYWRMAGTEEPISERATLLVLDRTIDAQAPLLHEYTYQAMVMDLLDVKNNAYKYEYENAAGQKATREVLLDENDALWPKLRHLHIADTIQELTTEFQKFLTTNKAVSYQKKSDDGSSGSDLKEMSAAIRAMPQYRELLGKYSLHMELAEQCMNRFGQMKLETLSTIEQNLVMHEDSDGNRLNNLIPTMLSILQDPTISQESKLRLLMLYIVSQEGIKSQDRKSLVETSGISPEDENAISNLFYLGVTLEKKSGKRAEKGKKKGKRKTDSVPYELSRYVPTVVDVVDSLANDKLDSTDYPHVAGAPPANSAPKSKSRWGRGGGKAHTRWGKGDEDEGASEEVVPLSGPRIIVFIAGGVTYSEIKWIYKLQEKYHRPVIIGSTSLLTPQSFLEQLKSLQKMENIDL